MTDLILCQGFSLWSREPDFPTYFQRRATTHEVVLVRTQVVATHVGLDNLEICIDRLVADEAVLRAKLTKTSTTNCVSVEEKGIP